MVCWILMPYHSKKGKKMLIRIENQLVNSDHILHVAMPDINKPDVIITMTNGSRIDYSGDLDSFIDVYNEQMFESDEDENDAET